MTVHSLVSDLYISAGEFQNNNKHGTGKYNWTDGTVFEGEWRDNQRNGNGTLTFDTGVLVGSFKDNLCEGTIVFDIRPCLPVPVLFCHHLQDIKLLYFYCCCVTVGRKIYSSGKCYEQFCGLVAMV